MRKKGTGKDRRSSCSRELPVGAACENDIGKDCRSSCSGELTGTSYPACPEGPASSGQPADPAPLADYVGTSDLVGSSGRLRRRTFFWILSGALIAGGAVFYFVYNPGESGFFPRCPFLMVTGWECPGCGSQRALHHLLHGHIAEAWKMNPLLVAMLPYLLFGLTVEILYRRDARAAATQRSAATSKSMTTDARNRAAASQDSTAIPQNTAETSVDKAAAPQCKWVAWARKNLYGAGAAWVILAVVVLFTVLRNIFGF